MTSALVLWVVSGLGEVLTPGVRVGIMIPVAVVATLRDAMLLSFPLPQNARLVPQSVVFNNAPERAFLQFGYEMGTGARTFVSATAPYVVVLAVLLLSPPLQFAVLAGVGFGLGRFAMPLSRQASEDGLAWDELLSMRLPWLKVMVTTATGGMAVWLAVIS